jgi:ATP-binding cassette subfamily C (CFTR/MRP) protein 1
LRPDLPAVLNGISFKIEAGEKIGVVGRTGAGKSSIMQALFRLVEPSEGLIWIDGVNILEIGLKDLRSKLAIIPQDPVLFSGTVRSNLDPFNEYPDDEIWEALSSSSLRTFVGSLQGKLDATVQDSGDNFSIGQRQLFCLARAVLKKTKIIVLDEATASIDLATDALIQDAIRKKFVHSTILTIAHRLNTIIDYDRVVVLEGGQIAEFDKPGNLVQREDSLFWKMIEETGDINAASLKEIAIRKMSNKGE